MEKALFSKYINTPIGILHLQSDNSVLKAITFVTNKGVNSNIQPEILTRTTNQLTEYFEGTRKVFNLEIVPEGTVFQQKVWRLIEDVEFGRTSSYLHIAEKSGSAKNTRAVGMANGKNPIPIIIPCHRIIGSNKKLTGYAGGIEKKRWLLQHELKHSTHKNLLF